MEDNIYDFPVDEGKNSQEIIRGKVVKRIKARIYTILFVAITAAIIIAGYYFYQRSKVYNLLEVSNSVVFSPASGTNALNFGGNILTYSKDGAGSTDAQGNLLWNQTFDMQNPMCSMCEDTVAFADYGGSTIFVQTADGEAYEVSTAMPIRKITVSNNGVVAAVLEDVGVTWIYLYDSNGEVISYFRTTMEKSGYPVDLDISPSGEVVGISYYYLDIGDVRSSVAFYNFGDVGQNSIDNYVSGYNYKDCLVPLVRFLDNDKVFALSDERISIYGGSQKPMSIVDTFIDEEVLSVFYGKKNIAVITRNTKGGEKYHMTIYSSEGKVVLEKRFDFDYTEVVFSDDQFAIYGNTYVYVATMDGRTKLSYDYGKSIRLLLPTASPTKFVLVTDSSIDTVVMK